MVLALRDRGRSSGGRFHFLRRQDPDRVYQPPLARLEESRKLCADHRVPDAAVPDGARNRRLLRRRPRQFPSEAALPSRISQRLRAFHRGGGAGAFRRPGDPCPVRPSDLARRDHRAARPRPVRLPSRGGDHGEDRAAGPDQSRGGHQRGARHRHGSAVFLLRRHGADDPACGDGRGPEYFASGQGTIKW